MAKSKSTPSQLAKRATDRLRNMKRKEKENLHIAIGKGSTVASSIGIGAFEDRLPKTIFKIPTKIILAGAAYLGAAYTKNGVSKALEGMGDSATAIYSYKVAMQTRLKESSPWVAGALNGENSESESDETGYIWEE